MPNGQIGSFGSVAQIKSIVGSRKDLFDLAASGPAAAGLLSAVLFFVGLGLSTSGLPKARPAHCTTGSPLPITPTQKPSPVLMLHDLVLVRMLMICSDCHRRLSRYIEPCIGRIRPKLQRMRAAGGAASRAKLAV